MKRHAKAIVAISAMLLTLAIGATLATAVAPVVTIEDASNVSYTTADVKGTVNPEGQFTVWRFQYISDAQYQDNIANSLPGFEGATTAHEEVSEVEETLERQLTGLSPDTTYHLRLQAENGDGQSEAVAANTFTTDEVQAPAVTVEDASAVTDSGAHFAGTVEVSNTDEAFNASCSFDYVSDAQFQIDGFASAGSISCDPSTVTGSEPQPVDVQADPTLQPNTTYHLRIRAANAGGTATAVAPSTFATAAIGPEAATGTNTPSGVGETLVRGYVNPHNSDVTECRFDYGPTTAYGQSAPCDSNPATKNEPVMVTAPISGLEPGALYHFQLVVDNGVAEAASEDGVFTSFAEEVEPSCTNADQPGAQELPDCRAWEQVSPVQKHGNDVSASALRTRAAEDGSAASFTSTGGFADVQGTGSATEYLAQRSAAGWSTHAIVPPQRAQPVYAHAFVVPAEFVGEFSSDLSRAVFRAFTPVPTADGPHPNVAETMTNLYLRSDLRTPGPGTYGLLSDCLSPPAGPCSEPLKTGTTHPTVFAQRKMLAGANKGTAAVAPLSHVIFGTSTRLTNDAAPDATNLYENADGLLRLVGRVPAGGGECDDVAEPDCVTAPSSAVATAGREDEGYSRNAISADGSRIVFMVREGLCVEAASCGRLYLRKDGSRTVQINVSEKASPDASQPATYWNASTDGSRIFFTSSEQLVETDGNDKQDLYMFEVDKPQGERLTRLSVDAEPADGPGGDVMGVLGTSEDGRYVYFAAGLDTGSQLVPNQPWFDSGRAGIYLWHEGEVSYVGQVSFAVVNKNTDRVSIDVLHSRVTPDGRHLLFVSRDGEGLTGYDHGQGSCGSLSGQGSCEYYLYSADKHELLCATCNLGVVASASAGFDSLGELPPSTPKHLNHPLSSDGRRVFFNTPEALLPEEDTNGKSDVYQYDVPSGRLHLISSGRDAADSHFMDASPSGSDVFFTTYERLVGQDDDQSRDLYDARVGGGLPSQNRVEPAPCPPEGEGCQGPASDPPAAPQVSRFEGPGDPAVRRHVRRRCPKGKQRVRRRGKARCVRRRKASKRRAAGNERRATR